MQCPIFCVVTGLIFLYLWNLYIWFISLFLIHFVKFIWFHIFSVSFYVFWSSPLTFLYYIFPSSFQRFLFHVFSFQVYSYLTFSSSVHIFLTYLKGLPYLIIIPSSSLLVMHLIIYLLFRINFHTFLDWISWVLHSPASWHKHNTSSTLMIKLNILTTPTGNSSSYFITSN